MKVHLGDIKKIAGAKTKQSDTENHIGMRWAGRLNVGSDVFGSINITASIWVGFPRTGILPFSCHFKNNFAGLLWPNRIKVLKVTQNSAFLCIFNALQCIVVN